MYIYIYRPLSRIYSRNIQAAAKVHEPLYRRLLRGKGNLPSLSLCWSVERRVIRTYTPAPGICYNSCASESIYRRGDELRRAICGWEEVYGISWLLSARTDELVSFFCAVYLDVGLFLRWRPGFSRRHGSSSEEEKRERDDGMIGYSATFKMNSIF